MQPIAPILIMEGVSKRYGGVRALDNASLSIAAGRIHAVLGENGAGKSTLIKILAGVVRPDAGRIELDGAEVAIRLARRRGARRGRLHLPGAVARSRPFGRRQHRHRQPAAAFRPDRSPRPAPDRGRSARARRRARHSPARAGQGPAAVAPADGRDRQGAGAQSPHSHPRRGDLGLDGGRRRQGVRGAQAPPAGGPGADLHLPSDGRDRGAGRRLHGVSQRLERRDLPGGLEERRRDRRDDDRPRV